MLGSITIDKTFVGFLIRLKATSQNKSIKIYLSSDNSNSVRMVFTVKKFFCLSLKTGANIAGLCGIIVCTITGYDIAQQQHQKPGGSKF